jgi:hypothetical protein
MIQQDDTKLVLKIVPVAVGLFSRFELDCGSSPLVNTRTLPDEFPCPHNLCGGTHNPFPFIAGLDVDKLLNIRKQPLVRYFCSFRVESQDALTISTIVGIDTVVV